jgi:hypothetical protein
MDSRESVVKSSAVATQVDFMSIAGVRWTLTDGLQKNVCTDAQVTVGQPAGILEVDRGQPWTCAGVHE